MDNLSTGEVLADVSLADRYDLSKSLVLLNGAQAVARLLLMQKERDRRAGFNTGGFISGYRGSPVGGLDLQFIKLKTLFDAAVLGCAGVVGVAEDIAGAVDAGPLAVPDAEHAVVLAFAAQLGLL